MTLPDDFLLSAVRPALGRHGVRIDAREARLRFPVGVRLTGVTVGVAGYPPVPLDELTASWEWTGLFRWLPSRLRFLRGAASGDFRFSPAFWNPSRGTVSLAGVSSADLPLPVFYPDFQFDQVLTALDLLVLHLASAGQGIQRHVNLPKLGGKLLDPDFWPGPVGDDLGEPTCFEHALQDDAGEPHAPCVKVIEVDRVPIASRGVIAHQLLRGGRALHRGDLRPYPDVFEIQLSHP